MTRCILTCSFVVLAALVTGEPTHPVESLENGPQVAVKALRFSQEPPSYAFKVTNNGTKPIRSVSLGSGGDTFLDASLEAVPTSIGSPNGWKGMHVFTPGLRRSGARSHSTISYVWIADDPNGWIQPGESLSGFSVQFAVTPDHIALDQELRPMPPDLTRVPFAVRPFAARAIVGTVELERVPSRSPRDGN